MAHPLLFSSQFTCVISIKIVGSGAALKTMIILIRLGLPVGFLLLRYSVLFTVDSLSLLYLHFYILMYKFWEIMH